MSDKYKSHMNKNKLYVELVFFSLRYKHSINSLMRREREQEEVRMWEYEREKDRKRRKKSQIICNAIQKRIQGATIAYVIQSYREKRT